MSGDWLFPIEFDVLDAATYTYLPGLAKGWVEFTREPVQQGLVVYRLSHRDLGDLGTITLRMMSSKKTELAIKNPVTLRLAPMATKEERAKAKERHKQRRARQWQVIEWLFNQYAFDRECTGEEPLFGDETPVAESRKSKGPLKRKDAIERAAKAHRLLLDKDIGIKAACKEAGSDPRQLERYRNHHLPAEENGA